MIHTDEFSYHVTEKTSAVGKGEELAREKPVQLEGIRVRDVHENGVILFMGHLQVTSPVGMDDPKPGDLSDYALFQRDSGEGRVKLHVVY